MSEAACVDAVENIVLVVDDDADMREALQDLLESAHLHSLAFASASEYLSASKPDVPTCLILDVHLPDINGLALQQQIAGAGPPIIFITAQGDVPSTVKAMKAGAIDFFTKPFQSAELLAAVRAALEEDRRNRLAHAELASLQARLASLTPRERDVLPLIASGLLNKQAAAELGISEFTVQIHRGNVMRKMNASSLADLVRMAGKLGIPITHSRRTDIQ